ncbi:hypothetical protein Gotur_027026 [Gossypium turneri]
MTVGHTLLSGSEKLLFREVFTSMQDSGSIPGYIYTYVFVDLMPTMEKYMALLRCSKIQVDRVYSKANLKDIVLAHPDGNKRVDVFALSIYGLAIFPKAFGHVDEAVNGLAGEGRFIGCAQLLLAWFHSHFWKVDKVSYRVFSENYSPLTEIVATPMRDNISMEKWMAILQNLQENDVEWRALWLFPDEILYQCGDFDWVPLLGIWGAIVYTPLLVLRQYKSRQFIPATQGLAECEFSYRGDDYKKNIREISNAWNQTRRIKN